jgi:outer membrane protein, multidrug efflux system
LRLLSANAGYKREQLGLKGLLQSQGVYDRINAFEPNSASVTGALNSLTAPVNLFQEGFDASWELDLFERMRRSVESANAQTESAIENRNDTLVSLEVEVVQTCSQLRGAQLLKRITLVETRDELAQSTVSVTTDLIAVYKAAGGGGWQGANS